MAKTGTQPKFKISTLKQQREAAELEAIIDEFGNAMRNANRAAIASHGPRWLTLNMDQALCKFFLFCDRHPNE